MAQWNSAIEVTFNDNDGKAGWRINPSSVADLNIPHRKIPKWIFKATIPE